jgi:hypothetical protein
VAKYVIGVLICKRKHPQIRVGQAAIKWLISLKKPKQTFITDSYRICQKLRDLKAFQIQNEPIQALPGMNDQRTDNPF